MADFLEEVKQDLRRQRYEDLFNRYKMHLLALAILLVAGAGAQSWYRAHHTAVLQAAGDQYREAAAFVTQENADSALPRLNAAAEKGTPGYKHLAMLQRAKILTDRKQYAEAQVAYETLIADSSADVLLRDEAVVLSAWLMLEHGDKDTKSEAITQRLQAMTGAGKPWNYTAQEVLALQAIKEGKKEEALKLLLQLQQDPGTPSTLRKRGGALFEALGGKLPEEMPLTKQVVGKEKTQGKIGK